jgi:hypothetical protein
MEHAANTITVYPIRFERNSNITIIKMGKSVVSPYPMICGLFAHTKNGDK